MPNLDNKRNAHPGLGQNQASVSLVSATPARDAVCGVNALILAEKRAHRSVGYKNSVSRFHMLVMSRCYRLHVELLSGNYHPEIGEKFKIFEPKFRIVTCTKYRDRIPQTSFVTNYYYLIVIPQLIPKNCACIKGRGTDFARNAFKQILRDASMSDWCVKVDMKDYFGSIPHDGLYGELFPMMPDAWARAFFVQTVENVRRECGLDLGSEVYQLSATTYLNRLDQILSAGKYIRYQDDLLYVGTKAECIEAMAIIREEVRRLGLTISEKKTWMQPICQPVQFLGFTYLRHETGRVTMKRLPELSALMA